MSDSEEKILPPTRRKLREARRRGELAKSKELVTAIVTAAGLLVIILALPRALSGFADAIAEAGQSAAQPLSEAVGVLGPRLGWAAFTLIGPLLLMAVTFAVLTSIIANGGVVLSATPILPKFERINPIKGFGRLFALRNLVELLKTFVKLAAILSVAFVVIRGQIGELAQLPNCGIACIPGVVKAALLPLLVGCCLVLLLFGLFDIGLQRWLFHREMRMTRTEHKRDRKESEGDPRLHAHRKKERQEAAQLSARTGMKHATFVVQSLQHVLAFRYARPDASVPILVARRGTDGANLLLAEARRSNVPVVFDPDAAEALQRVEVGKMIPKAAFASIIRVMREARVIG